MQLEAQKNAALVTMNRELNTLRGRLGKAAEDHKVAIRKITDAGISGASSYAFGYIEGRWGGTQSDGKPGRAQIGGIPASGVVGAVLITLGLSGQIKGAEYLEAVGVGAADCYLALKGLASGQAAKAANPG